MQEHEQEVCGYRVCVVSEKLSDESKAFNVRLADLTYSGQGGVPEVELNARTEEDAYSLAAGLASLIERHV